MGSGMGIGIGDWGLIGDWDWILGLEIVIRNSELGIGIGDWEFVIGIWDWRLGIGIGDLDWGLVLVIRMGVGLGI